MIHIQGTLVSEDVLTEPFCCDLNDCKGGCCNSEGESGAPLEEDELKKLDEVLPVIWDDLMPQAQEIIKSEGGYFKDKAGDWVTNVVNGRDCVYCTYGNDGMCLCAIEKAFRAGRLDWKKPISCHLYPIRLKQIGDYLAVNYDEQKAMCGGACKLGRKINVKVYQCVKEALIRKFGQAYYDELELVADEYSKLAR